jgi:hypothetical protein
MNHGNNIPLYFTDSITNLLWYYIEHAECDDTDVGLENIMIDDIENTIKSIFKKSDIESSKYAILKNLDDICKNMSNYITTQSQNNEIIKIKSILINKINDNYNSLKIKL